MPFNPSGIFERLYSWVADRDNNIDISPERMDAETNGIVGALNEVMAGDRPFRGPVRAPYGTAANPGLTFEGDTNTGFARTSADAVSVTTGGVARVTFSSTATNIGPLVTGNAVQELASDTAPGKIITTTNGYHRGNLVGTVAQTGGIPTAGAMEYGSTANGTYSRFANGDQWCAIDALEMPATTQASGGIYISAADGVWIFPRGFIAKPIVTGSQHSGGVNWLVGPATVSGSPTVSARMRLASPFSTPDARSVSLIAKGRWF